MKPAHVECTQGDARRKQSARVVVMFVAIVLMVGTHASVARADEQVTAHVPFAFIVGESRLPAGDYIVKEMDSDPGVITVASTDGHQSIFTLTMTSSSNEKGRSRGWCSKSSTTSTFSRAWFETTATNERSC